MFIPVNCYLTCTPLRCYSLYTAVGVVAMAGLRAGVTTPKTFGLVQLMIGLSFVILSLSQLILLSSSLLLLGTVNSTNSTVNKLKSAGNTHIVILKKDHSETLNKVKKTVLKMENLPCFSQ